VSHIYAYLCADPSADEHHNFALPMHIVTQLYQQAQFKSHLQPSVQ